MYSNVVIILDILAIIAIVASTYYAVNYKKYYIVQVVGL